ncbi:GntR family transcriptional regulator [Roseiarcus fermentans]|uniref:GntR family transcriptional regulator n=1 Tax=Roseiarcus fermentans TaxID=1473586 RepID=A0A366FUF2_9HYPH|nr:PLP-dependent aminotransferase family protein [Roseiarcus fermentans]RBP18302.1 GntR family transcriptional regulator [Roseiarcus fermentans]
MDARPPSRVEGAVAHIRDRIATRTLAHGARLPSVRELAEKLGVSKSTVVEAYERLAAEGAVVARRGSGFFVAGPARPLAPAPADPPPEPAIDPSWINQHAMMGLPDFLCPGAGWLPDSWVLDLGVQRALRLAARDGAHRRRQYDEPMGFAPLRRLFSVRLAERDVLVDPDQVIVTDSCSQALDLVCRFLLRPGDTVVVDDPCYFNFLSLLKANRANVVAAPLAPDGPDVEALERLIIEHRPRLYLTNAGLQNPTGATLSPAKAHRVLRLAEDYDLLILEDDTFGDFEPEPAIRLAGLDGLRRVVQVGSATKAVGAATRCGYIAAAADWIGPLVDLKLATSMGNSVTGAAMIHRVLTESNYRRHLDALRGKAADAMGHALRKLRAHGLEPWIEPRAGIFLWARLPDGIAAADVARYSLTKKVLLAPGPAFSASDLGRGCLRFNVARCVEPRIFEVLDDAIAAAPRGGS